MRIPVPDYEDLLGLPYEIFTRGPSTYSCFGLAIEIYRRAGIEIYRDGEGPEIFDAIGRGPWEEMDIVCFGNKGTEVAAHVGILIDWTDQAVLHAARGRGVVLDLLPIPRMPDLFSYRLKAEANPWASRS